MTRTRISFPLPVFLLAAAVVALVAFGATRWIVDRGAGTLPPLEVTADAAAAAPGALDGAKVFQMRVDTTVSINATIDGQPMNGAGVVVNVDGTIVTASHVVKDYDKALEQTAVFVRFHSGEEVEAQVQAVDQYNDLAILKVDPRQLKSLVAAPLAKDSDSLVVGSEVLTIGAPYGYEFTPTYGHVSAVNRVVPSRINGSWDIPDAIQYDAATNPGNSGGPLFNARGEVVGISQQIATANKSDSGVSFAVSSNLVRSAIERFQRTGTIEYAWLGIEETVSVTPQLGRAAELGTDSGAMVQRATGPASAAGISIGRDFPWMGQTRILGDVIVELAGRPITTREDLIRAAGLIDAEAPVEITYIRGGSRETVTIDPMPRVVV